MKISKAHLERIIIEEYIKEEGIDESQAAQDLLRQILGDEEYERRQALKNRGSRGGDTKPMKKPNQGASDTMPLDLDDAPSDSPENLEDQISNLIKGMPPEEVQDLFQAVFARIPGVEMGDAEPEPETLYSPGAEGRPQVGFREELINRAYARILEMAGIPYSRDDEDENLEETEEDV